MAIGFVRRHPNGSPIWLHATRSVAAAQRVRDARWGDFLNIVAQDGDGWAEVAWGDARYFIREEEIVAERPLELLFVDVGQGDGCIVVPPEMGAHERVLIVDAGQYGHMLGLVKWRFGKLMRDFRFHAAILTHPDQDHYLGFRDIFRHPHAHFDCVYHNGIAERTGPDPLGATDASGRYLTGTVVTSADVDAVYATGGPNQSKTYGRVMRAALDSGRVGSVEMLSTLHGQVEAGRTWLPQFAPSDGRACTIEVLGPVPETGSDGRPLAPVVRHEHRLDREERGHDEERPLDRPATRSRWVTHSPGGAISTSPPRTTCCVTTAALPRPHPCRRPSPGPGAGWAPM